MSKIVIDIETIGVDFDSLDEKSQEYLLKYSENEKEKEDVKQRMALYPFTGEIVAIGMLNPDTNKGSMLYQNGQGEKENFEENGIVFKTGTEEEILKEFWNSVKNYNQVITFNGRGFDAPYLHLRSALFKIIPSKNLMPYRYDYKIHCDLLEQLTYYGAVRKFTLDFYAKSFGFESPKESGANGSEVGDLYKKGEYKKIARYCVGDVIATKKLYEYWDKYLRF